MNFLIDEVEIDASRIGEITVNYRKNDGGGSHYHGKTHFEEYRSAFYPLLKSAINPQVCIDIGANYGYTGMLMQRAFPDSRLILVEPIPWLENFVRHNFENNNFKFDQFHSAICSITSPDGKSVFGVREKGSQDSRVIPQPGMRQIEADVVTLDEMAADIGNDQGVYIKIDTQGWEERVFNGGEAFLGRHDRWFIKTEFAPAWLESQKTNPAHLLRQLMDRYDVHETPGRLRWNCENLAEMVGQPLLPGSEMDFIHHVRNLGARDTGWVDLYVMPPAHRRAYSLR
ncbi:MAG: FkbM family methyltransferase [Beijerinckiaceae bacterium]|nr:FkbM family methyltransferase [Beijerinckiaceae bacterium]